MFAMKEALDVIMMAVMVVMARILMTMMMMMMDTAKLAAQFYSIGRHIFVY